MLLHPSLSILFESSHSSPVSTVPLPHSEYHKLGILVLSHTNVASSEQVDEHPSPSKMFPSSQVSPASSVPLPQFIEHGVGRTVSVHT